jgi:hypothetical protein
MIRVMHDEPTFADIFLKLLSACSMQTQADLVDQLFNRLVTGVTWVDGDLWHATSEGDESELRRVDPHTGEVFETLEMPQGALISGLESDGGERFFCGGQGSGKVRAVRRPSRVSAAETGNAKR